MTKGQKFVNAPALVALMLVMGMMLAAMPVRAEEVNAPLVAVTQKEGIVYFFEFAVDENGEFAVERMIGIAQEYVDASLTEDAWYVTESLGALIPYGPDCGVNEKGPVISKIDTDTIAEGEGDIYIPPKDLAVFDVSLLADSHFDLSSAIRQIHIHYEYWVGVYTYHVGGSIHYWVIWPEVGIDIDETIYYTGFVIVPMADINVVGSPCLEK